MTSPFQGSHLHSGVAAPFIIYPHAQVGGNVPLVSLHQFILSIPWEDLQGMALLGLQMSCYF